MCELTLAEFLADESPKWEQLTTLEQKEYALHKFLNEECGACVLTDQVEPNSIRVHADCAHEIIIDTTDTLEKIDAQIEAFLNTL